MKRLDEIMDYSKGRLSILKEEMRRSINLNDKICVYVCGSLGRLEMSINSDLDLFFISMDTEDKTEVDLSNIQKYVFFSELYKINGELEFQEPSKGGHYWDFISKTKLLDMGSRHEDYNNSFTARMLLILESKPIYNEDGYNQLLQEVINKYFTDYDEHKQQFYPLILMNDIFRYWYTLTLNYEYRRDPADDENKKNWKRLKLKYARLITCFSMLACLYKDNITPQYVIDCIRLTPFERLRMLSDTINGVSEIVKTIEEQYEWFLSLKKEDPTWWISDSNKSKAISNAEKFHDNVVHKFMKIVSETNPKLRSKTDVY